MPHRSRFWPVHILFSCGAHAFQVKASPRLINDSNGNRTTCYEGRGSRAVTWTIPQACPSAFISWERVSCSRVTCTGAADHLRVQAHRSVRAWEAGTASGPAARCKLAASGGD
jgi:hypothetical protein